MKSIKFLVLGLMTMSIVLVGCKKDDPPQPVSYVEDGFYVVGEATSVADLFANDAEKALMAAGINENDGQKPRTGMYEKYVALEGGKSFSLMQKAGAKETKYGASLTKVNLADAEGNSVNEQPKIEIFKGTLTENGSLQVTESGLYHVVLDVDLKTIIIAPAGWGVRGAMNGWNFTAFPKPTFNKTEMTFTLTDVEVAMSGDFKYAYGGGWKIELNPDGNPVIKANTNLGGAPLTPGGSNIAIERGKYKIELKWTLAKGDIKNSYTATVTKTGEVVLKFPEHLYMIGQDFGDWKWESDGVVELIPVHPQDADNKGLGSFWCVNYFTAGNGFKWAPGKAWSGDFASLGEEIGYKVEGGNAVVDADGLYVVYIDMAAGKIAIEPAKVYGMGDCFGGWNTGEYPFTITDDKATITTTATGDLRMYVGSSIAITDWWTREFIIFDDEIVYRGTGNDQERVRVSGGMTITLDFKAGTASMELTGDPGPEFPDNLYVVGDGTLADWTPANGIALYPVTQIDGMFYGVVWLKETGKFKFCVKKDWGGDFGKSSEDIADYAEFGTGGGDIPVPGTAGYYVIFVDMANELISVVEPEIYAAGAAFGNSWGEAIEDNLFTVDNTEDPEDATITSPVATDDGNLRAFIPHAWVSDWWKTEVCADGEGGIVFKNNPPDVPLTAGQKVVFNFNAGTATIE